MKVTESTKFIAQEILDYIERFPERHDQHSWFDGNPNKVEALATTSVCNSTMCIAGTAVYLTTPLDVFKVYAGEEVQNQDIWTSRGSEVLGLTGQEANQLFYSMSNQRALEMLEAVAEGDEDGFRLIAENTTDSDYEDYQRD